MSFRVEFHRVLGRCLQYRLLQPWLTGASIEARNRVPTLIPCAPRTRAAASPRPSATPPAATTGIGLTASTTWGKG